MLTKFENKEIMTRNEIKKKYSTKEIIMITTKSADRWDDDLGYVIYTADCKRDFRKASLEEYNDVPLDFLTGCEAEPYPSLSGVVYYD